MVPDLERYMDGEVCGVESSRESRAEDRSNFAGLRPMDLQADVPGATTNGYRLWVSPSWAGSKIRNHPEPRVRGKGRVSDSHARSHGRPPPHSYFGSKDAAQPRMLMNRS